MILCETPATFRPCVFWLLDFYRFEKVGSIGLPACLQTRCLRHIFIVMAVQMHRANDQENAFVVDPSGSAPEGTTMKVHFHHAAWQMTADKKKSA
ncbi:MAG: hypothetical protein ONB48_15095 [candidate division KSB1 bacterium]|nr:hypothetical protein [candidate division KSB1 bacterium]MDZ7273436.1 hypothetical protein [candidate division KSB1 bacterium]MDZ7286972.1 hypothetical protein [candidate division KSB1 bacterium]MDZ7299675.1 hypothetical protein [candidate division KSB1 bacterium]MDZ7307939.1 hypothetical protein [candidate division KSB1 bacterium]